MLPPEGWHFQPHSCAAGQRGMQELKLSSEAELKNLQASKQKLLDPLSCCRLRGLFLVVWCEGLI